MTITTLNVAILKKVKNDVIGNPSAKLSIARDEVFVSTLVDCLNAPEQFEGPRGSQDDIRIEAAQVLSSLSYGSPEALHSLLCANAHQAILFAISQFNASESVGLKAAFARALRALAAATAEIVGPSQWGLHDDDSSMRDEAKVTLEYFFQLEVLDVYLPLLNDSSPQVSTSVAQLLGSALRTQEHRHAVAEWLPPVDRNKDVRSKRGWEKLEVTNAHAPGRQGGWVARNLIKLLRRRDVKVQEAALCGLAALAQDNYEVAAVLAKPGSETNGNETSALSLALALCKTRITSVQLAAGLCATHIIRASTASHHHPVPPDMSSALTVMHVMNRLIASPTEPPQTRTKACFILNYLVANDNQLCQLAFDRGSLSKLAALVKSITPTEKASEWDEDEAESVSCLREAALIAISVLAMADNGIRCDITDNLHLIPFISVALSHRYAGVRYGACQCVRALSRSVAVVRTSLFDSDLGRSLYQTFANDTEDPRVTYAALLAVCNLVNEHSPMREPFLNDGLIKRLLQLIHSGHAKLKLNALWALKNLIFKYTSGRKQAIMNEFGWDEIERLLSDPDSGVQEQALHVLRNFASSEEDVEQVFQELGGDDALLQLLKNALTSKNGDVVLQGAWVLCNLANGTADHQAHILGNAQILRALRSCLVDAPMEVRRAAVSCVLQLASGDPWRRQELREAGIDGTLRHICEYAGAVSPISFSGNPMSLEREVKDKARQALDCIEHGGELLAP